MPNETRQPRQPQRASALSQALKAFAEQESAVAGGTYDVEIEDDSVRCGERGQYRLRVANTLALRLRAWRLTYEVYQSKGYARADAQGLWFGPYDAHPETITLLAETDGVPTATMSLVFDSTRRLPADELYAEEIDAFRARGRTLCELVSLVSLEEGLQGAELMKYLFKLAYIAAHHLEGASDLFITVNPRHAPFYERLLLFARLGSEVPCPKVNDAPAVLLHMDLVAAWDLYRERFEHKPPARNLYRFFLYKACELRAWLAAQRRPLDVAELDRDHPALGRRLRRNALAEVQA